MRLIPDHINVYIIIKSDNSICICINSLIFFTLSSTRRAAAAKIQWPAEQWGPQSATCSFPPPSDLLTTEVRPLARIQIPPKRATKDSLYLISYLPPSRPRPARLSLQLTLILLSHYYYYHS